MNNNNRLPRSLRSPDDPCWFQARRSLTRTVLNALDGRAGASIGARIIDEWRGELHGIPSALEVARHDCGCYLWVEDECWRHPTDIRRAGIARELSTVSAEHRLPVYGAVTRAGRRGSR